jgi:hypothetical protein
MEQLSDHRNYLEQRAEDELRAAQEATHPAAVQSHYTLASLYLDRLYGHQVPANDSAS